MTLGCMAQKLTELNLLRIGCHGEIVGCCQSDAQYRSQKSRDHFVFFTNYVFYKNYF